MEATSKLRVARWSAAGFIAAALFGGAGVAGASQRVAADNVAAITPSGTAVFVPLGKLAAPGGGGRTAALPGGSCSGVQGCNDFIAECVGAGGDFVPGGTESPDGSPTSGSCGTAKPLPAE